MRVLIMTDMEGVSGIVVWEQVEGGKPLYEECRRLYTEEINAAVRGAKAAGATEIVVVDCHGAGGGWTFNSLVPELLDPACEWVNHHPWGRYTELLEKGCDAALFVGMHARAGTPDGVLCHTISSTTWRNLYFNDFPVGETGINAAVCGHYNCPVLLVTGDEATCREAKELLGEGVTTVAVKKGLSRFSARNIPPVRARQMIEDGAREALKNLKAVKPYKPKSPCTITIDLPTVDRAGEFRGRHGVTIPDPLKVVSKGKNWMEAWNQIWHWRV
ncbi:M55 family metallopeptidase [Pedosphaera parvula]|uniref:Peptidase M55 D-aminopeptidase n=1 Tax=Pedosphaera parvula (strain Ellin514) TaxID=320771 RepID=B9XIR2_PEDPL|nr:M55 family metallopeptidase [Pedosphaera parvula]EEF60325.1 peptidase M55 D-aminopeptidase [Pedosphaera parvula Ellin514]